MDSTNVHAHPAPAAPGTNHMPQLDGLRAVAVALVFVHHTPFGEDFPIPLGGLGVKLFFVLSGFLITGILLNCREQVDQGNATPWHVAKQFYIRRFLRIFPLYYFVIACAALVDYGDAREIYLWLLVYANNILVSLQGEWNAFGHFWSLAVEEHFYLMWPWLLLFAPKRTLLPATILLIVSGPLYRLFAIGRDYNLIAVYCATPACFDALGVGSLLAMIRHAEQDRLWLTTWMHRTFLPLALIGLIGLWLLARVGEWKIATVFSDLLLAMGYVCLVDAAALGFSGSIGRLLASQPVTYVGKISYGVYVYHVFVPHLMNYGLTQLGVQNESFGLSGWLLAAAFTVLLAAVSWTFFESPLNDLKRLFPYVPAAIKA